MAGDANVVLVDAKVFTAALDRPWARALAVRDDRIVAVGTNRQAERWAGRRTRTIDLEGRVVVPGFIDAHAHMAHSAAELGWTDLNRVRSLGEAVERLRRAAKKTPAGRWVVGTGWDEARWPEGRFLRREDLDRVSRDHPVVARRIDCHLGSFNSIALERTAHLAGARGFEVDPSGRPTGILKEDAFGAAFDLFAADSAGIERGLPTVARRAHRLGITAIHDIVGPAAWGAYQRAHRSERLLLRVNAMPKTSLTAPLLGAGLMTGLGDAWLRLGPIKVFADGSLGAHTASLREAYADRPTERGMLVHAPTELRSILEEAHRGGFQTATHAIGDDAIRLVVDTLEQIQERHPRKDARHRIEHFELPDEEALRRAKAAGIVASCQPNFIGQWSGPGGLYEARLGKDRTSTNNPLRSILRRRIPLCFGSDGMPYGPLYGIHWAVNGYFEHQQISVEDAFRAATATPAYASFEEALKGTLEPGKLADFVVLEGDPFREPGRIAQIRVGSTWIGGRCVFARTES